MKYWFDFLEKPLFCRRTQLFNDKTESERDGPRICVETDIRGGERESRTRAIHSHGTGDALWIHPNRPQYRRSSHNQHFDSVMRFGCRSLLSRA